MVNDVALRPVGTPGLGAGAQVTGETARGERGETARNEGLKAGASDAEKRVGIDHTCVDGQRSARQQGLESTATGAADAEMPAKTVARPAGNEPEARRGVDQGAGDFVHGAVAADGD